MLVALAGGVGAARMLSGLVQVADPASITTVVNTGDDMSLHGLHISPDLDTVTYTLAGMDNAVTGWGIAGETWTVMASSGELGGETWFSLGDRDLATHLYRTGRLADGATLSQVTAELAAARGWPCRLLPMSDDPVRTRADRHRRGGRPEVAFQDYFVRLPPRRAVESHPLRRGRGRARRRPACSRRSPSAERDRRLPLEPDRLDRPGRWPCPASPMALAPRAAMSSPSRPSWPAPP